MVRWPGAQCLAQRLSIAQLDHRIKTGLAGSARHAMDPPEMHLRNLSLSGDGHDKDEADRMKVRRGSWVVGVESRRRLSADRLCIHHYTTAAR